MPLGLVPPRLTNTCTPVLQNAVVVPQDLDAGSSFQGRRAAAAAGSSTFHWVGGGRSLLDSGTVTETVSMTWQREQSTLSPFNRVTPFGSATARHARQVCPNRPFSLVVSVRAHTLTDPIDLPPPPMLPPPHCLQQALAYLDPVASWTVQDVSEALEGTGVWVAWTLDQRVASSLDSGHDPLGVWLDHVSRRRALVARPVHTSTSPSQGRALASGLVPGPEAAARAAHAAFALLQPLVECFPEGDEVHEADNAACAADLALVSACSCHEAFGLMIP